MSNQEKENNKASITKKVIAIIIIIILLLLIRSCGKAEPTPVTTDSTPEVTHTAEPTPTPVDEEETEFTGVSDGENKGEVEVQQPEVKPVHTHSFTVVHSYVDATCTEGGTVTFKCESCNATETRPSTPYGHDYKNLGITAATCTTAGSTKYECRRCGKTKTEPGDNATGHLSWDYKNDGATHTASCPACRYSFSEAHTYSNGVCVCGELEVILVHNDGELVNAGGVKRNYTVLDGNYTKPVVADGVEVTIEDGYFDDQIIAARNGATVIVENARGRNGSSGQNLIASVSGGSTVIFEDCYFPLFNSLLFGDGTGTVIINGGYFDGGCFCWGKLPVASLTITGGTFGSNFIFMRSMMGPSIASFVPDTHTIVNNADGSCTVVPK